MPGTRRCVSSLGDGWNPTLEWYAKAVLKLRTMAPNERTSWRYLGAIHGFNQQLWIDNKVITDKDPLPAEAEWNGRMWNQCQHRTWYFLPWHRGYLYAFESIIAATVKALGGPEDWALPYWNYLSGASSALKLPKAFTESKMPDKKTPNPLLSPRKNTKLDKSKLNLKAMDEAAFTAAASALGFGGGETGFNHSAGNGTGALESNPHNQVHVQIGKFMTDPRTAALDPIFWLHHCNIDRLWSAWLSQDGKTMEDRDAWKNGPPRQFEMPGADGELHVFTPADTIGAGAMVPTYDDLRSGTGLPPAASSLEEISAEGVTMPAKLSTEPPPPATLVGANSGKLTITDSPATTEVKLQPEAAFQAAGLQGEQRVFLNLENVRGDAPSAMLAVRISAGSAGAESVRTESVALFGLGEASAPDGEEDGNGISIAIDITEIANELARQTGTALEDLKVSIAQEDAEAPVTVERVSIYKQTVG